MQIVQGSYWNTLSRYGKHYKRDAVKSSECEIFIWFQFKIRKHTTVERIKSENATASIGKSILYQVRHRDKDQTVKMSINTEKPVRSSAQCDHFLRL